jgi:hypothetical protein
MSKCKGMIVFNKNVMENIKSDKHSRKEKSGGMIGVNKKYNA